LRAYRSDYLGSYERQLIEALNTVEEPVIWVGHRMDGLLISSAASKVPQE
jgi:hypothetical protein